MLIPMKWIREYTDIEPDAQKYAAGMIMTGTAVEGIEKSGSQFSKVVVGRVLTCEPHPDSDHLHVCQVDVGDGEPLKIVCGAPNVHAGMLVATALIGATLPAGSIKKGRLRGVDSYGMLCSGPELDVPEGLYPHIGDEGIIEITEDVAPGTDVKEVFGLGDDVIEFEILANRPDCLSVWGIARESAAVFGKTFRKPDMSFTEKGEGKFEDYASVEVRDTKKCPRYCARVVTNVRIGRSPLWMREYLNDAGIRPINNIVDITNFVMLETGHPMHAFDLDKVKGHKIIVRDAYDQEELVTLDGKKHILSDDMLVIADGENATGLAGIMGGEESEITGETKTVLFECAAFDRANNRITSRKLGVHTEASGHFAKGVFPESAMEALERALSLTCQLDCGNVVPGAFDCYPAPAAPRTIKANCGRIRALIGVDVPDEEMLRILTGLSIPTELTEGELICRVPAFRGDMETSADVAEEVLRMYGYDHIPSTLMNAVTMPGRRSERFELIDGYRQALKGLGLFEIMNYSFISPKQLVLLGLEAADIRMDPVKLRNPLGDDTSIMRTSLVPSMLGTIALNLNRGNDAGRLFEISKVFLKTGEGEDALPEEKVMLCLGLFGEGVDFYTVKDIALGLGALNGVQLHCEVGADGYYHPGRSAKLLAGETVVGQIGELHPDTAEKAEIEKKVYIAEIDAEKLVSLGKEVYGIREMPKYPAVTRDLAVVTEEKNGAGLLMEQIRAAGGKILENVGLFDVFRGGRLGEGKKSLAYSLTFRAQDRTLTDEDVQKSMDKILKVLKEKFDADIRS